MALRILQLAGSPVSDHFRELSELYARGCIEALQDAARYEFVIAHVSPDGSWRFPISLADADVAAGPAESFAKAVETIEALAVDAALPQMFCLRGMTDMRALLDLLEIPYLGNPPSVMALAADKVKANAIVAAAGVAVPAWESIRAGARPTLALPAVVKPNDADNSEGLSLVRTASDYPAALEAAFAHSKTALVQSYVELGREVRCGVVERDGELHCLPLEEYFVDAESRPVRRRIDKLKRSGSGDLTLAAKTRTESWIVPLDDPIVPAVWDAARRAYAALGSRHYNLFDFRIDRNGKPWFLEAGPYCSFAPQSVIVTMMEAAGVPLARFFAESIEAVCGEAVP